MSERNPYVGIFRKWGNYWVAKLMEFLFNSTSLTDVGCTLRCVRREALLDMQLSILMKMKMIQIPVNYTKRVGHSSVTGNKWVAFRLGLRMIRMILGYRLRSWFWPKRLPRCRENEPS